MEITANRLELLALCKRAAHIASDAAVLEELRGVLLETQDTKGKLTLTATNFELSLQGNVDADIQATGSAVVNAKLLTQMLGALDGERVAIDVRPGNTMMVSCGTCEYLIHVLPGRGFPQIEIPFPADTVSITGIPMLAHRTTFSVLEDSTRPIMQCVNLMFSNDGLRAVASDGCHMVVAKGNAKNTCRIDMLMPAASLRALARMVTDQETLRVGTTGKAIVFLGQNFTFSARLMEGRHIDADALLQNIVGQFTVLSDGEVLWEAVSAVESIAPKNGCICLSFHGNHITISCDCEYGTSSRELEVIPLIGSPVGSYYYTAHTLVESLKVLNGTLQLQIAQSGMLLLSTEHATCLQSAVRTPAVSGKKQKKTSPVAA